MKHIAAEEMDGVLEWCTRELGPIRVESDDSKEHPGHISTTCRIATATGSCFLKVYQNRESWSNEVHAYEQWAPVLGRLAPRLLAVREDPLPAIVIGAVPGRVVDVSTVTPVQGQAIWRAAGKALRVLHGVGPGRFFGACHRDGSPIGDAPTDPVARVAQRFRTNMENAMRAGLLSDDERKTLEAALTLVPAFAGERPTACHMDYFSGNWLVNGEHDLTGVIDFEFAHWNVRVGDFTRDAEWSWIRRPHLYQAFLEGYGGTPTAAEERQRLVGHAEYALSAIHWGHESEFFGFEREGREALVKLAPFVR